MADSYNVVVAGFCNSQQNIDGVWTVVGCDQCADLNGTFNLQRPAPEVGSYPYGGTIAPHLHTAGDSAGNGIDLSHCRFIYDFPTPVCNVDRIELCFFGPPNGFFMGLFFWTLADGMPADQDREDQLLYYFHAGAGTGQRCDKLDKQWLFFALNNVPDCMGPWLGGATAQVTAES